MWVDLRLPLLSCSTCHTGSGAFGYERSERRGRTRGAAVVAPSSARTRTARGDRGAGGHHVARCGPRRTVVGALPAAVDRAQSLAAAHHLGRTHDTDRVARAGRCAARPVRVHRLVRSRPPLWAARYSPDRAPLGGTRTFRTPGRTRLRLGGT